MSAIKPILNDCLLENIDGSAARRKYPGILFAYFRGGAFIDFPTRKFGDPQANGHDDHSGGFLSSMTGGRGENGFQDSKIGYYVTEGRYTTLRKVVALARGGA